MKHEPLTLALPKGRLDEQVQEYFKARDIHFSFDSRKLVAEDDKGLFRIFLVKNVDVPTYVHHGIAGLGVSGEDTLYETGLEFLKLFHFPFGSTRMCLCAHENTASDIDALPAWQNYFAQKHLTIASKFTQFTKDYFYQAGIDVDVIKLNGSVELASVLGLSPFIVDLVETGSTLKANKLKVVADLAKIGVHLIANQAYFKFHYKAINKVLSILQTKGES